MKTEKLLDLFKYFKNEKVNPFVGRDDNAALWWDGEKLLYENVKKDDAYWNRLMTSFDNAINAGNCGGNLLDNAQSKEKRAILFFLDIWHGRNFPYDSFDVIKEY